MNLLIFEYATTLGLQDPSITVEGQSMLEGLLTDLNNVGTEYLLSEHSTFNYNTVDDESVNIKPVIIREDLSSWLDENISNYDACFFVAPEENLILYKLTKNIEEHGVKIIGSSSGAVLICSDKFETFNLLDDHFPMVRGEKVYFSNLKDYKDTFSNGNKMLVKPVDGVSCTGVQVVQTYADFIKASAHLKRNTEVPYFLLQDYLGGVSASVSILSNGKKAIPLSLNQQEIVLDGGRLVYNGGRVPYEHGLADDAREISKKAVEFIDGLRGYVGVDLLLDEATDEIRILEINPRLTTSYIALRRLLNFNLGEAIINAVNGKLPDEIILTGSLSFSKSDEILFK